MYDVSDRLKNKLLQFGNYGDIHRPVLITKNENHLLVYENKLKRW